MVSSQHLRTRLTLLTGAFDDEEDILSIPLDELLDELRSNVSDTEQNVFDYGGEMSDPSDVDEEEEDAGPVIKDGQKKRVCAPALDGTEPMH